MTNETIDTTRRRALRLLGGAPMLPLATFAGGMSLSLSACGGGDDDETPAAHYVAAAFQGMAAPSLAAPAAMATTTVASTLDVNFSDGSKRSFRLGYQPFFMTGDAVPDGSGGTVVAGGYYNIHNQPIMDASGATLRQFFSDCVDGSSLLALPNASVAGVKG
jgi:hypothetical protein